MKSVTRFGARDERTTPENRGAGFDALGYGKRYEDSNGAVNLNTRDYQGDIINGFRFVKDSF